MKIESSDLMPSTDRKPFFDGTDDRNASYEARCLGCSEPIRVTLTALIDGAAWRGAFPTEDTHVIESFFDIGHECKALVRGRPSVSLHRCEACGTRHVFYADFNQPNLLHYQFVAQGWAAVSLNNSF